ncbi:DNA-binding response regulator [Rhodohalobacter sp. SW132]|uniref:response regulator n=1 Tax=Rhodohalobacter sp. SW132 TaxID=2293433 RepID=UPI000E285156|nr:response regulator transcription factor [Rhodohalobacter sp. SW132]REL38550.1 DNA-binding response regulator [Rhodohalobacter sp. SW132]
MINVIVADDHPLLREGVKKVLTEQSNSIRVIKEVSNAGDLMNALSEEEPDLVILDITMPNRSGLDAMKDMQDIHPKIPVLILSMHPEDRFAIRAIKAGAWGYVNKSSIGEELVKSITTIVKEKRRYINSKVAEELARQIGTPSDQLPHHALSDREFQVFHRVASGMKISDIAKELSLSVQTIHTYKTRLKKKMDLKSNADLTRYAIQHNLADLNVE